MGCKLLEESGVWIFYSSALTPKERALDFALGSLSVLSVDLAYGTVRFFPYLFCHSTELDGVFSRCSLCHRLVVWFWDTVWSQSAVKLRQTRPKTWRSLDFAVRPDSSEFETGQDSQRKTDFW
jgi:hypothetical protein